MELTWNNALHWQWEVNKNKEIEDEPKWNWDCNFKLDFDGSLLSLSGRFYPPHYNGGDCWEGDLGVLFLGEKLLKKTFKEDTLEKLRESVENFTKEYIKSLKERLF